MTTPVSTAPRSGLLPQVMKTRCLSEVNNQYSSRQSQVGLTICLKEPCKVVISSDLQPAIRAATPEWDKPFDTTRGDWGEKWATDKNHKLTQPAKYLRVLRYCTKTYRDLAIWIEIGILVEILITNIVQLLDNNLLEFLSRSLFCLERVFYPCSKISMQYIT